MTGSDVYKEYTLDELVGLVSSKRDFAVPFYGKATFQTEKGTKDFTGLLMSNKGSMGELSFAVANERGMVMDSDFPLVAFTIEKCPYNRQELQNLSNTTTIINLNKGVNNYRMVEYGGKRDIILYNKKYYRLSLIGANTAYMERNPVIDIPTSSVIDNELQDLTNKFYNTDDTETLNNLIVQIGELTGITTSRYIRNTMGVLGNALKSENTTHATLKIPYSTKAFGERAGFKGAVTVNPQELGNMLNTDVYNLLDFIVKYYRLVINEIILVESTDSFDIQFKLVIPDMTGTPLGQSKSYFEGILEGVQKLHSVAHLNRFKVK